MSWLDWLVLAAYGFLMLGVGVFFSHRNKTADEYLLGGRRMSPVAVGCRCSPRCSARCRTSAIRAR